MSRGLGRLQHRIYDTLDAAEGKELSLRELRRRLGEPNRSNLRRGIRGLLRCGLVQESRSAEGRSVKLTFSAIFWGIAPPEFPRSPLAERRAWRKEVRALKQAREEERRRLEAEAAKGPRWVGYKHQFVRRRGPTQARILNVLWEYAEALDEGLPVAVVKSIVGGDRSNTRRAIRTLLLRGQLEESEDGERVRLSYSAAALFRFIPPMPEEPIDDEHAKAILQTYHDARPSRET